MARSASRRRVMPDPSTNATPVACRARIDASVTASTGGVSMITHSNGPLRICSIRLSMRFDPSSSEGLCGGAPAGITHRLSGADRR